MTVLQNFLGGPPPFVSVSLVLDTPTLITADSTIFPGASLTCSNCDDITFDISAVAHGFSQSPPSTILYDLSGGVAIVASYFDEGSFRTVGTYNTIFLQGINDATLSVEASSSLPEPMSILLLGTVAGCMVAKRNRFFKRGSRS